MTGSMIASETSFLGPCHADESSEDETAVHGCHCPRDMAVRMRKVLAIPREVGSVCLSAEIDNKIIRIIYDPMLSSVRPFWCLNVINAIINIVHK